MVSKVGLYAYGLVAKSPKQLNILGIDKKNKVFFVEGRNLAVLVSKIDVGKFQCQIKEGLSELAKAKDSFPRRVGELLRTHEGVVDTLGKLTTVAPFKFGTILKDEEAVFKMLEDDKERFEALLSKFTGKEEWGIKVYADSQKFKNYLTKSEPKLKVLAEKNLPAGRQGEKLSRGAAYLLGRKLEEDLKDKVTAQFNNIAELIFREAKKYAFEAKLTKTLPKKLTGKDKEMILNSAYLIEKDEVSNFNREIKKLKEKYERAGIGFEVSGPWPPYSFT
ncbi:GvpL/GvpF family gas vesicle protein [Patescibacteria group bacterium]|nr:GvpL/GvpF family gas vesicle protein [Patescibacteria group bacterium]